MNKYQYDAFLRTSRLGSYARALLVLVVAVILVACIAPEIIGSVMQWHRITAALATIPHASLPVH